MFLINKNVKIIILFLYIYIPFSFNLMAQNNDAKALELISVINGKLVKAAKIKNWIVSIEVKGNELNILSKKFNTKTTIFIDKNK